MRSVNIITSPPEYTAPNLRDSSVILASSDSRVRSHFSRSHDALHPLMVSAKKISIVMLNFKCESSIRVLSNPVPQDIEYSLSKTTYHTARSTSHQPVCLTQLLRLCLLLYESHNYVNLGDYCDVL